MTLQIELPSALERQLEEEAARSGQEAGEYVVSLVERQLQIKALEALKHRKPPQTLADVKPRVTTPPGQNWLESIRGQWPGDETDEEIERLLEEIS